MTTDALFPPVPSIPVEETIRGGLNQLPEPCWEVFYADGKLADGERHHVSREDAEESYDGTDDGYARVPKQCADRCWTATAACGYRYDTDTDGTTHFTSANEAIDVVTNHEWRIQDGVLLCPDGECWGCAQ